ncbi:group II intron reverse transcriptase/maturase [Enterococcus faecium]|nr:group II intron reverse transcriptase/maturase [Enterococcus faecium]MCZ2169145.1 group II intron reverse transcriptase/maturase [Enterococcus faecium]MCZ2171884.1 group II intron reverse transcriptase/maturase [Enterococcus faecium]MCZ2286669.1 group II intron reverse transcriptase/maturase [Enterococcus faecium]MCZ2314727.1 group II intron reverse transcriptase/maturase [Enterococcus faecium]
MPKNKNETLCVEDLRHAEYYEMQNTFDDLYAKSKNGDIFTHLMDIILSRENILLAYRNIKANAGSKTAGTDGTIIKDIGKLPAETVVKKVRYIVAGSPHGYRPKPVRRKEIPKPNGKTRPLGIPCMWDRLIQQCIKQVLEPICEAKFSENSYGFRPNRSVENAIKATYNRLQISQLHYVIEFDIKGFFDNVNHSKLIKQIWAMGIRDKHLIFILKRILKAPIKMTNGTITYPEKGTPQGGIISPLLANIVLNELDHWVESQWQENPVTKNYVAHINKSGSPCKSNAYKEMKKTKLKEMYMVRYADDFRVFCRYKESAEKAKIAITQWIEQRLKLEVSQEKTRIVNVRKRYSDFLGFKIKMIPRRKKLVVKSHISDKQFKNQKDKLVSQAKKIASPSKGKTELEETRLYNSMVLGMQNYYQIATNVNLDCMKLNRAVMAIFTNRLGTNKRGRLRKTGRQLTTKEATRYGKSKMLRYVAGEGEPIFPVGYIQHRKPMAKVYLANCYTLEGRKFIHTNLSVDKLLMYQLMKLSLENRTIEYADNRISLFSAQHGKCAITLEEFQQANEIHCHHIVPTGAGGNDDYKNLILVKEAVHRLIHAKTEETIQKYIALLKLNKVQLIRLNKYRVLAGNQELNLI